MGAAFALCIREMIVCLGLLVEHLALGVSNQFSPLTRLP